MLSALLTAWTLAAPCTLPRAPENPSTQTAEVTQGPALVIDGQPVPFDEFATWLVKFRGESSASAFLSQFLLEREAVRLKIELASDTIDARVEGEIEERIRLAFGGDVSQWEKELTRLGSSAELHRRKRGRDLRSQFLADRIVANSRIITQDELQSAFERKYGRAGRKLWVRRLGLRLRVTIPQNTPLVERQRLNREAQARLTERLTAIREEGLAGTDFASLIETYNEDKASETANAQEAFRTDRWPVGAVDAIYALEPNGISEPSFGRGYFYLFQLLREEKTEFASVEASLRVELVKRAAGAQEVSALVDGMTAQAKVEVLPALWSESGDWDEAVMRIDDESISRGHFGRWLAADRGLPVVRSFVEGHLSAPLLRDAGVEVSPHQVEQRVDAEIQAIIDRFHEGDPKGWEAQLARQGNSPERVRRERRTRTRLDLGIEQLILRNRTVTAAEVEHLWEQRYGKGGRKIDVRILQKLMRFQENAGQLPVDQQRKLIDDTREATVAALRAIRERALAGEDFASIVQTSSEDEATRRNGGRYTDGFAYWSWPRELQVQLDALEAGQISEPFALGNAVYLFELVSEELIPVESVADALHAELMAITPRAAERAGFMNQLVEQHAWTVHPENFPEARAR
ncbi:MAG: hypothetical protein ACI841_003755 [Planctomycetota bacterium]|jgi:hypothetical protein